MTERRIKHLLKVFLGLSGLFLSSCTDKGVQVLADAPELKGFKDDFKYGWIKHCYANENKFFLNKLTKINKIRMNIAIGDLDLSRATLFNINNESFYIIFRNKGHSEYQYKQKDYIFNEMVKKYAAQVLRKRGIPQKEYGRFDAYVTGFIYSDVVTCGIGDETGFYDGIIFIEKMEI